MLNHVLGAVFMNLDEKLLALRNMKINKRILEIEIAINKKKTEILNNELEVINGRLTNKEEYSKEEYNEIVKNIESMEITDEYVQELLNDVENNSYKDEEGFLTYDFESDEDYIIYLSVCYGLSDLKNKELEKEIAKLEKEKSELKNLEDLVTYET